MRGGLGSFVVIVVIACTSCDERHLRGSVRKSLDGKTYLLVADGSNCDQIKLDGVAWPHPIGKAGEVGPGDHTIDCNGLIGFKVPQGVIFKFDYWGP